ncbi:hypothetical protein C8J57DRAFT_1492521 [Mycena rebaudengoi]|nr:hypothetical protein C8J57DRAFT_1492521 [Mycena rebaudengoi]
MHPLPTHDKRAPNPATPARRTTGSTDARKAGKYTSTASLPLDRSKDAISPTRADASARGGRMVRPPPPLPLRFRATPRRLHAPRHHTHADAPRLHARAVCTHAYEVTHTHAHLRPTPRTLMPTTPGARSAPPPPPSSSPEQCLHTPVVAPFTNRTLTRTSSPPPPRRSCPPPHPGHITQRLDRMHPQREPQAPS